MARPTERLPSPVRFAIRGYVCSPSHSIWVRVQRCDEASRRPRSHSWWFRTPTSSTTPTSTRVFSHHSSKTRPTSCTARGSLVVKIAGCCTSGTASAIGSSRFSRTRSPISISPTWRRVTRSSGARSSRASTSSKIGSDSSPRSPQRSPAGAGGSMRFPCRIRDAPMPRARKSRGAMASVPSTAWFAIPGCGRAAARCLRRPPAHSPTPIRPSKKYSTISTARHRTTPIGSCRCSSRISVAVCSRSEPVTAPSPPGWRSTVARSWRPTCPNGVWSNSRNASRAIPQSRSAMRRSMILRSTTRSTRSCSSTCSNT